MILITGGFGFLGSHVAGALLGRGQSCLLAQRGSGEPPDILAGADPARLAVAAVDVTDRAGVSALGEHHSITGVIHLAAGWMSNPFDEMRDNAAALANVAEAAKAWGVSRILIASTIGVYGGSGPGRAGEDRTLPHLGNPHPVPTLKKMAEMFAEQVNARAGIAAVVVRIGGLYGPRYRSLRTFISRAVHAAAERRAIDLGGVAFGAGPDDGGDWVYVKDCAEAIAGLATAPSLGNWIYNAGSGQFTSNRAVVATLETIVGEEISGLSDAFRVRPDGATGDGVALDIARIGAATGYAPRFSLEAGLGDYLAWLRAGHAH